jgi:hypothetical protein
MNAKADRLLRTGRVHVAVDTAVITGDTGRHTLWVNDEGLWACDCASYTYRRTCSHIAALRLITMPPPGEWGKR